jgi:hypothetical protein
MATLAFSTGRCLSISEISGLLANALTTLGAGGTQGDRGLNLRMEAVVSVRIAVVIPSLSNPECLYVSRTLKYGVKVSPSWFSRSAISLSDTLLEPAASGPRRSFT